MGPNTLSGVIFLAIGGLASATNFIPFRQIKRWSWEVYWPVQALAAWLLAPAISASLLVPNWCAILRQAFHADPHSVWLALLFGMVFGLASMAFGLSVRYLGITQGYAATFGFFLLFAALAPIIRPAEFGPPSSTTSLLLAAAICLVSLALTAAAARRKDAEMTLEVKLEAGEQDFNSGRGLLMAALAGVLAFFFLLALQAAAPITSLAQDALLAQGRTQTCATLPALVVILAGSFATNFIWSAILIARKGSVKQLLGEPGINPMRAVATSGDTLVDFDPLDPSTFDRLAPSTLIANYLFAALAGGFWFLQLAFYLLGNDHSPDLSFSPKLLQFAFTLVFAGLWGLAIKEWSGVTARTRLLAGLGLAALIATTLIH